VGCGYLRRYGTHGWLEAPLRVLLRRWAHGNARPDAESMPEAPVIAAAAPTKPGREAARPVRRRPWRAVLARLPQAWPCWRYWPGSAWPTPCSAPQPSGEARAVARVAQSALLREVPRSVAAARLASRYLSASAEAQVGGDLVEVIADGANPRWLVGDTRGKGLPAVRLASVAATSFRDACARPGLPLIEVARAVDLSVTRAAGEEDFVTAVFAELDPAGWIQLVICGHPPPLRLSTDGELVPLAPATFTAPLGLHPDLHLSTFSVRTGDRLLFFTDGLLEARDRAGRFFRVDQQIQALSRPDLQAAADELLARLRAHTRRRLDDDVAVLLAELTLTDPAVQPAVPGQRPAAGAAVGAA
jgi:phosphoserine phosphatase RsbU/P